MSTAAPSDLDLAQFCARYLSAWNGHDATAMADLVTDGRSRDPRIPETDFRLSRFAEGALLASPFPYSGAGQMR